MILIKIRINNEVTSRKPRKKSKNILKYGRGSSECQQHARKELSPKCSHSVAGKSTL